MRSVLNEYGITAVECIVGGLVIAAFGTVLVNFKDIAEAIFTMMMG